MDALLTAADSALRTLFATPHAARDCPTLPAEPSALTPEEKALSGALMRVNHVGEVCAQAGGVATLEEALEVVAEALVLIALLPLKTVVPYTILVDRNTGYAQALDERAMPNVKPESALTQSLLKPMVARGSGQIISDSAGSSVYSAPVAAMPASRSAARSESESAA
mgnify:CR=1 FL=1